MKGYGRKGLWEEIWYVGILDDEHFGFFSRKKEFRRTYRNISQMFGLLMMT